MTANKRIRTIDLTYMGMFVALLAVSAWIVIPATVPFTMQTFAVFATIAMLGMRKGALTIIAYILLGLAGVPVFSGFTGGFGVLAGPTGGYLVGFVFSAIVTGAILKRASRKTPVMFVAMVAGLVVCYIFGTIWFMFLYSGANAIGSVSIWTALTMCVFPYVLPDLVKIALAVFFSKKMSRHITSSL